MSSSVTLSGRRSRSARTSSLGESFGLSAMLLAASAMKCSSAREVSLSVYADLGALANRERLRRSARTNSQLRTPRRAHQRAIDDAVVCCPLLARGLDADLLDIELREQVVGQCAVIAIEGDETVETGEAPPFGVRRLELPVDLIVHPCLPTLH